MNVKLARLFGFALGLKKEAGPGDPQAPVGLKTPPPKLPTANVAAKGSDLLDAEVKKRKAVTPSVPTAGKKPPATAAVAKQPATQTPISLGDKPVVPAGTPEPTRLKSVLGDAPEKEDFSQYPKPTVLGEGDAAVRSVATPETAAEKAKQTGRSVGTPMTDEQRKFWTVSPAARHEAAQRDSLRSGFNSPAEQRAWQESGMMARARAMRAAEEMNRIKLALGGKGY